MNLFFEENLKIIEEETKKQKNDDNFQDEYDNKIGSSSSLKNSYNSCKSTIRPNLNNSKKSSLMKTDSLGNLMNYIIAYVKYIIFKRKNMII